MKPVNHLNYFSSGGMIYCEKEQDVVEGTPEYYEKHCMNCPFLAGHLQGEGIECTYEDSTVKDEFVSVLEPYEYQEKRSKARRIESERRARKFTVKKK